MFCDICWISEALPSKHIICPFFHTFHPCKQLVKFGKARVLCGPSPGTMYTASIYTVLIFMRMYGSSSHVLCPLSAGRLSSFSLCFGCLQHEWYPRIALLSGLSQDIMNQRTQVQCCPSVFSRTIQCTLLHGEVLKALG